MVRTREDGSWVACRECDDTRKLKSYERCVACGRSVDKKGNCIQCPDVPAGSTCSECGRKKE